MVNNKEVPRGYSIPLLDLDQEYERQVIVDQEKGQYLGHVTTVLLEDEKTILAVYPKGHGRGPIVMKRSLDGGQTWSGRLTTPESWSTSREVPTIFRTVDPKGKERLLLFSGLYPIRMSVSEDNGLTWSELEPIGDFGGIVAMSDMVPLPQKGSYMAFFHDDGRFIKGGSGESWGSPAGERNGVRVYSVTTTDGGLTWSSPKVILEHSTALLCEAGAVISPDGKQIALLMRENSHVFNSMISFSDDYGQTWTEPKELPGALTGERHTVRYVPDGRLIVAFRDMAHISPTRGDFVVWVGTYEDLAAGREGQYRIRLKDNIDSLDSTYPGLEVLPDGIIVATTYGHWTKGEEPYIISVRFSLHELDDRLTRALKGR